MALETGTYIDDLVSTNPAAGDGMSQGDDHIRLLKATLKATFPNITGAMTSTHTQLIAAVTAVVTGTTALLTFAGTSSLPGMAFVAEPALGFYRVSAGIMKFVGGVLRGNGAVAVGSYHFFPKTFAGIGSADGTGYEYLECNGAVYTLASYPELGAYLGSTYGGNGTTTFGVPDAYTAGKFLRSRTAALTVGTAQANALKSHTHTGTTASNGSHTHTATDAGHTHTVVAPTSRDKVFVTTDGVPSGDVWGDNNGGASSSEASGSGTASITVGSDGAHTHTFTSDATGDTETRPEALAVIMCLKT